MIKPMFMRWGLALLAAALLVSGEARAQSFTGYPNPGQIQIGQAGGNPATWENVIGPISVNPNGTITLSLSPTPFVTGVLAMNNGGCGAALLPQAGSLIYSTAVGCALLPRTPLANQVLMSGMGPLYTPQWSPAIWSQNYPASSLLFANGANNIQPLSPCASGVLVYSSGSVPSCSGTLPSTVILPPPGASFLGAVQSKDCSAGGQFVQKINTDGTETCATPAGGGNVSNSGTPTAGQVAVWISATQVQGVSIGTTLTNSLGADVNLNNTGTFFDGPSVAQGTSGIWCAMGQTIITTASGGNDAVIIRLTDGTTVFSSGYVRTPPTGATTGGSIAGCMSSAPAGNIRLQAEDTSSTTGKMSANNTGQGKDSTVTVWRIQ